MKLTEIVKSLNLQVACGEQQLDKEVCGGYSSDLLSDVMANSKKGDVWITLQVHPNVVAVAMLKEIAGIVMINGRMPEKETIEKAESEGLPIMTSDSPAFELVGRLYEMGISGKR
ncbi:serine kinase [candidate division WOR_3 bacterium SM23_42]|uniref:Serine kinase n=1 Tax=candidate division WOR_3 bacterium SM23_42 TaxID=1703779 RepID=A0A0S8FU91_UNCW3|nr:MAG: serine kinase [candidate division WOR_3 bacterium SM23_42]